MITLATFYFYFKICKMTLNKICCSIATDQFGRLLEFYLSLWCVAFEFGLQVVDASGVSKINFVGSNKKFNFFSVEKDRSKNRQNFSCIKIRLPEHNSNNLFLKAYFERELKELNTVFPISNWDTLIVQNKKNSCKKRPIWCDKF